MYIAFNKSNKTLMGKLIRFFTKSEYVHCELVTVKRADKFYGYSAFPGEGVRAKWISYEPNEWEFIKIPSVDVKKFLEKTEGKKYDYLGALGFVFGNNDNPNRWFCSEWCATVLGLENPSKLSPGDLYKKIKNGTNE